MRPPHLHTYPRGYLLKVNDDARAIGNHPRGRMRPSHAVSFTEPCGSGRDTARKAGGWRVQASIRSDRSGTEGDPLLTAPHQRAESRGPESFSATVLSALRPDLSGHVGRMS